MLAAVIIAGCGVDAPITVPKFMTGEHLLRKMISNSATSTNTTGGFFIFSGSFNSSSKTEMIVRFAWKMDEDTYVLSSIPIEKIRVKIHNDTKTPTISFKLEPDCYTYRWANPPENYIDAILENCVYYATITAKDNDWPTQIDLPLNQPMPVVEN
ncbi:MAG: hypothetical protein WC457_00825 [Patescibacteria group bacterium]